MTRDRYITLCEQLNKEPSEIEMPPDWEDLPESVQTAINIFNMLGDRRYPEIGYIGKDYTNYKIFMELFEVEDKEFCHEIILWLDSRAITQSAEILKREYDKLKRNK